MRTSLKFISVIFVGIFFTSCSRELKFPQGGYDYPAFRYKNIKNSFNSLYYFHCWSVAYNEPELNIKPLKQNTFRLTYETAFGKAAIFIITQNEIVVKQPIQGSPYPDRDMEKLNQIERLHYRILQHNFPIQEMDSAKKGNLDSFTKVYPQLLTPAYYKYLLDKSAKYDSIPFKYSTKRIKIPFSTYEDIVTQINASGYWNLPFHIECEDDYLDGFGFILEANTSRKYNVVSLANCPEKSLKFSQACQSIVDAANLEKEITIIRKN